jgi:hypothetical protein
VCCPVAVRSRCPRSRFADEPAQTLALIPPAATHAGVHSLWVSTLAFIASLAHAFAWPLLIGAIVWTLRSQLRTLVGDLGDRLSRVEARGIVFTFVAAEARAALDEAGVTPAVDSVPEPASPPGARSRHARDVLVAYAEVERELRQRLAAAAPSVPDEAFKYGALRLAILASGAGLIAPETVRAVNGVAVLRNLVASGSQQVDAKEAAEYRALVDATLYAIRNGEPTLSYVVRPRNPLLTQGPYDTLDEAEARIRELADDEFPASIWGMPVGQPIGVGRVIREYETRP